MEAERLRPVHRSIFSVMPLELLSAPAWHAAAVLAGGRGSGLCDESAGWWLRVRERRPAAIHVAVTGPRTPVAGIRWHRLTLADGELGRHGRMPVTSPARTALDLAMHLSSWDLKGVLAELEFRYGLHPADVRPVLRRGHPGAARLRRALDEHTPQLAATRSELERLFLRLLEEFGFEIGAFNHEVGRSTVDVVFADAGVVVELDGVAGHTGERRVLRDHRRDLHRRADGYLVLRYHHAQLLDPVDRALIAAELDRLGVPRVNR